MSLIATDIMTSKVTTAHPTTPWPKSRDSSATTGLPPFPSATPPRVLGMLSEGDLMPADSARRKRPSASVAGCRSRHLLPPAWKGFAV